ncbi:MAG: L,D-transpeptidase family protein, partial [Caulobacterales bacterium]
MRRLLLAAACAALLAACSPPAAHEQSAQAPTYPISTQSRDLMELVNATETVTLRTRADVATNADASIQPEYAPLPAAQTEAQPATDEMSAQDAGVTRIQVLLDRAHYSPGVIDGYDGENVRKAISEYQARNNLTVTGVADDSLLETLSARDSAPALVTYVIAAQDVAGPFVDVPSDLEAQSRLDRLGYESAAEALAEKFHMDEDLLRMLNPNADFARPGTEIVVANAGGDLNGSVASIVVDKEAKVVRAFDANDQLLAFYPATIGSGDAPAPTGDFEVRAVALNP